MEIPKVAELGSKFDTTGLVMLGGLGLVTGAAVEGLINLITEGIKPEIPESTRDLMASLVPTAIAFLATSAWAINTGDLLPATTLFTGFAIGANSRNFKNILQD